jgi:hypothetical protein
MKEKMMTKFKFALPALIIFTSIANIAYGSEIKYQIKKITGIEAMNESQVDFHVISDKEKRMILTLETKNNDRYLYDILKTAFITGEEVFVYLEYSQKKLIIKRVRIGERVKEDKNFYM